MRKQNMPDIKIPCNQELQIPVGNNHHELIRIMKAIFLLPYLISPAYNPDDIIGKWHTGNGEGLLEIYSHGGTYYGKLISLKVPNDAYGKPGKDNKNVNPALNNRSLIKILIFRNMEYSQRITGGEMEVSTIRIWGMKQEGLSLLSAITRLNSRAMLTLNG